jgi:hypothetical protein
MPHKIKIVETCSTVDTSFLKGQTYEVLDALAWSLVKAGHATIVDEKPVEKGKK